MKLQKMKQGGFTLLELLVVVAILAIIAGAVISAISGQEERAGQGVALNTMGALENATRQQVVINKGLPSDLDSLVCADTTGGITTATLTSPQLLGASTLGGLADGLAAKLVLVDLPVAVDCELDSAAGTCMLTESGITSLRYAEITACDDIAGTTAIPSGQLTAVGGEEAVELLANTLFWNADNNGAGLSVSIAETSVAPIAILLDPTDIGQDPGTVVGVFGVGNFSEMSTSSVNKIISRGPIDGNVDGNGERYSHFSLAIKLGEAGLNTNLTTAGLAASTAWEADEVGLVAVLDSDGDNFDDEVAEFAGLEDE